MSATKYNKQMASAKSETPLVAASTSGFNTNSVFAPQEKSSSEPDKVTEQPGPEFNPPKPRIGKGRPFTPSQKWTVSGSIATCIVEPGFVATIDASDLPIADGHRWYINQRGHNSYVQTGNVFSLHRMVLGLGKGDPHVDHIDRNALNCRRENLRVASQSQNRANSRKHRKGQSDYKGVRKSGQKWTATVGPRKGRKYLGTFPTEEAAARAHDIEAVKMYGEFACLNFPLPRAEQVKAA